MPGTSPSLILLPIQPELAAIDILPFIADSVISTDDTGRILVFNRAAERCFGYTLVEVLGEHVNKLLPRQHRAQHVNDMRAFGMEQGVAVRNMGDQREVRGLRKNGEEFPAEASVSRHSLEGRTILTVVLRDIAERKELEVQREVVARELDHRVKNVLSVVSALVSLTAKNALNVAEFKDSLQKRLGGLAATQAFLAHGNGKRIDLHALLGAELTHYRASGSDNLLIRGTTVALRSIAVQPLALIIHELGTNSAKYGAFSASTGCATITTELTGPGVARQLIIEWRETGGPLVKAPDRLGFGTLLIKQMIERNFHGTVTFDYEKEGLISRMVIPANRLQAAEPAEAGAAPA